MEIWENTKISRIYFAEHLQWGWWHLYPVMPPLYMPLKLLFFPRIAFSYYIFDLTLAVPRTTFALSLTHFHNRGATNYWPYLNRTIKGQGTSDILAYIYICGARTFRFCSSHDRLTVELGRWQFDNSTQPLLEPGNQRLLKAIQVKGVGLGSIKAP